MNSFTTAWFLLGLAWPATADPCALTFGAYYSGKVIVERLDTGVTDAHIEVLQVALAAVGTAAKGLKLPDKVVIRVAAVSEVANEANLDPLNPTFTVSFPRGELHSQFLPVVVHELGHLIFSANMHGREGFQRYQQFVRKASLEAEGIRSALESRLALYERRNQTLSLKLQTEQAAGNPTAKVEQELAANRQKLEDAKREADHAATLEQRVERANKLLKAYNEVIADVFSVLQGRDGTVMAKTLAAVFGVAGFRAEGRDFTIPIEAENFNHPDYHLSLAPMRNFLWERALAGRLGETNHSEPLQRIFTTLDQELLRIFSRPELLDGSDGSFASAFAAAF